MGIGAWAARDRKHSITRTVGACRADLAFDKVSDIAVEAWQEVAVNVVLGVGVIRACLPDWAVSANHVPRVRELTDEASCWSSSLGAAESTWA